MNSEILQREDVNLRYVDFGGSGEPVLLLHGLCGTADEWADTAQWLGETNRVVAFDQRGHGQNTRRPASVVPQRFVDDAVRVIEHLKLQPVTVIGQSTGGRTAFALAAQHSKLVSKLVVVEATPTLDPNERQTIGALLECWSVPFPTREAAREFFGGRTLCAKVWADSLEVREDGLYPRFDIDVTLNIVTEKHKLDWWPIWRGVQQHMLIVSGENSSIKPAAVEEMAAVVPRASIVTVPDAGHDLHLENPSGWRDALASLL